MKEKDLGIRTKQDIAFKNQTNEGAKSYSYLQESPYITRTQPGLPPRIDHLLSLFNGKVSQFSSKQQEKRGIAKVSKCNFLGFLHQCTAEE